MPPSPEISFCLPVFNSAERIERCLRAVLAQNVPSREILVVDNSSTDDTVARARRLLDGVPGARLVVNDRNLGRIENWNRCLELASGQFLRFALVNDVLLPGSTAMLLAAARDRPAAVMICSRLRQVVEVPATPEPAPPDPPKVPLDTPAALRRFSLQGNDTGGLGAMLLRRDVIQNHSLRFRTDIPFWSDFLFAIELADHGETIYLDADSYLFDLSVKGRFSQAGLAHYYQEGTICARAIADRFHSRGLDRSAAFEFLYRQFTHQTWNYEQPPLRPAATLELFAGAGQYRALAVKYAKAHRRRELRQKLAFKMKRLASRLGLERARGKSS